MLYGEVFAPDIDPECNPDCEAYGECGEAADGSLLVPCHTGRWITPIVMTIYLLVANILLINLLIASFNTIYNSVNARSLQFWNFQRFSIVLEYEEKPVLPAPLIIFSHAYRICKYFVRMCRKGRSSKFESGLKVFLSKFDLERLYDFEEECVEGMMKDMDAEKSKKTEVRVKSVQDTIEELRMKFDDIERWEAVSSESSQSLEFRLQRMEELAQQTANQLAVIHRFMAMQRGSDETSLASRPGSGMQQQQPLSARPSSRLTPSQFQAAQTATSDAEEEVGVVQADSPALKRHPSSSTKKRSLTRMSEVMGAAASSSQAYLDLQMVVDNNVTDPAIHGGSLSMMSRQNTGESALVDMDDEAIAKDTTEADHDSKEASRSPEKESHHDVSDAEDGDRYDDKAELVQQRRLTESTSPTPDPAKGTSSIGTKVKKLVKTTRRVRRLSSGASSVGGGGDPYAGTKAKKPSKLKSGLPIPQVHSGLRSRRHRYPTESSTGKSGDEDLGDHNEKGKGRLPGSIKLRRMKHFSQESGEKYHRGLKHHDQEEPEAGRLRLPSGSGQAYFRSVSDNVTGGLPLVGPPTATLTTTGSGLSHTGSEDEVILAAMVSEAADFDLTTGSKHHARMLMAARQRRKIQGKRRNYTSITDELELLMTTVSPPCLDLPIDEEGATGLSPPSTTQTVAPAPPSIQIESELLHDAEEADYHLMEDLIHKRLRRSSTNLLSGSFEDLMAKSIRDDQSPTPSLPGTPTSKKSPTQSPEKPTAIAVLGAEEEIIEVIQAPPEVPGELPAGTGSGVEIKIIRKAEVVQKSTEIHEQSSPKKDEDETKC